MPDPEESPDTPASDETADETASTPSTAPANDENALTNIMVNVLIPVVALSALSKTGDKAWHIGPLWGMLIAVALPATYGIWFLFKNRKFNLFSVIGVVGILLTGGITLFVWNDDGTVKENAALLFAIKEAAVPIILGLTILASHRTKKPLVEVFLLNPDILDTQRIERAVAKNDARAKYDGLRWQGTLMLAGSLFLSAVMNFFLAMHFLGGKTDKVAYNAAVGKLTWVGFLVIGIPLMVIMMSGLFYLLKKIRDITGLGKDDVFLPR
jgi:hypothetical protein